MCYKGAFLIFGVVAVLVLALSSLFPDLILEGPTSSTENTESHFVKAIWHDDPYTFVEFRDETIDPADVLSHSQQFYDFARKIGEKHTNMVLVVPKANMEVFKLTLSDIFLKAVADENKNREREGLKPVEVLLYVSSSPFMSDTFFSSSKFWLLVWFITLTLMACRGGSNDQNNNVR